MPRVNVLTPDDVYWDFAGSNPAVYIGKGKKTWGVHEKLNPFPCYAHDPGTVRDALRALEKEVTSYGKPLKNRPDYYLLPFEGAGATQAWASKAWLTGKNDNETWKGIVFMSGKRTPLHPAVTRYLTAHEYGHHADYDLCRKADAGIDGLDHEYAKLRKLPPGYDRYGGGRWHTNVGEVMANDFRILIADVDPDFWPHDCKHPYDVPDVTKWWAEMLAL